MSWRVSVSFAGAVVASALGGQSSSARADEAYLCGPDKVVYVAVQDLEHKKRTDPCIAAYYGLTVEQLSEQKQPAPTAAAVSASRAAPKPLADLKPLSEAEIPERAAMPVRQASLEPPRAMPGTDYRNVKVLNAVGPGSAWFYHAK